MTRFLSYALVGILAIPAFVHAQDVPKKEPAKKIVVPFELIKTQHMVVSVKINGKGPYRLVFDTGAPDSLVSVKIHKEAGLVTKAGGLEALIGMLGPTKIKQIELGDLKAENITATVFDHPTVKAISSFIGPAGPIEGILGFTFYARYKMSIDYEKKQMTFEPNNYEPSDVMKQLMDRLTSPDAQKKKAAVLAPAGLVGIRVGKEATDEDAGVTVKDVLADSPAAAAGFKTGDRLLTLDGRWTDTVADCYQAAKLVSVGAPVTANVLRDGKKLTLKLTVRAGL